MHFENDIIEELDKKALLSTFSKSDRIIVKLYDRKIANTLNTEEIPTPHKYNAEKFGKKGDPRSYNLWSEATVKVTLNNTEYPRSDNSA